MSDTRFIIAGSILVFAGFLVGGVIGSQYVQFTIQADQFGDCFDYSNGLALHVDCNQKMQEKFAFFGLSIALIGGGVFVLIKGIKGKWDQNVKSNEMVGPKNG